MSTTTTTANDIVPADNINDFIASFEWPPLVAEMLAWIRNIGRGQGGVADQARWDEITTPSGTKGENVEFPVVSASTSGVQIAASYVGLGLQLSRELTYDAKPAAQQSAIVEATMSVRNRIDSDWLSLLGSAASSSSISGTPLTGELLGTECTTFRALKSPAGTLGYAICLGNTQTDSLLDDLRSAGATMTPVLAGGMDFSAPSMLGQWEGFTVFCSQNAATSGADDVGGILAGGDGVCPLQLAIAERVGAEIQPDALSKSDLAVIAARFGTGIVLPARVHAVISI